MDVDEVSRVKAMDWIPIALGPDIPAGETRAVLLDGVELVVWRGADGAAHVWTDRCPHRGMRLSFGFVRGTTLNCLYHGWQYGADGGCRGIPAHPDLIVPRTIHASTLVSAEAGGWVWLRTTGDAASPPDTGAGTPLLSLVVEATPERIAMVAGASRDGPLLRGDGLVVGWHGVAPGKTMLHAVSAGGDEPAAAVRRLRRWRDEAEREKS